MDEHIVALFDLTRGRIVESIHYGAIAVVDAHGQLLYSCGDPQKVAFLRSSAKPFQALPFFERGGPKFYGLTPQEQALLCASHEGSDEHVRVVESIQAKVGIRESDLQCGVHLPGNASAYKSLIARGEAPTPNRNNCSGKHSGMLAHAKMRGLPLETYLDPAHPVQQETLAAFAEMCDYPQDQVEVGTDGCSAPNFAVPLHNAALAFARLCDPRDLGEARADAARRITTAMTAHPEMISGPAEFDCRLMQAGKGRIVCKRGAEGFQALGLLPGSLGPGTPGVGIVFKVSDGDPLFRTLDIEPHNRVRPAVTLEILKQIGALNQEQQRQLSDFGPMLPVKNHRGLVVGQSRPVFHLRKAPQTVDARVEGCAVAASPEGSTLSLARRARRIHERLYERFGETSWRNPLPPIDELISTILSQNTNDLNRDRAFEALRARFPTWEAVRDARQTAVIAAIRSAGLANQKGPRIQKILRAITKERRNLDLGFLKDLPLEEAHAWLMRFRGVGPKTAAIVLLFSLGLPAFPVDTHIYRVTGRLGLRPQKMTVEQAHRHLESLFPPEAYGAAHLNLIRLGRELCHPRKPECPNCPVRSLCDYAPKTKT